MFDLLITKGQVFDGKNNNPKNIDIGIKDGRIVALGSINKESSVTTIDADGLAVSPGFIDIHSHAEISVIKNVDCSPKILQGVTTDVVGNCGLSLTPAASSYFDLLKNYIAPTLGILTDDMYFQNIDSYFKTLDKKRFALNIASFIGHGALRIATMGFSSEKANTQQMATMKNLLDRGLDAGALGISFGLIYAPGCFADDEEIIELVKVAAKHGKMANFHMRNESNLLLDSVKQLIGYSESTGAHMHISHLKASGEKNWGQMETVIDEIEKANERGLSITCDMYPYTAGSTTITALMPQWALQGGVEKLLERLSIPSEREHINKSFIEGIPGWDSLVRENGYFNIIINSVENPLLRKYEGRSISDIARLEGVEEFNALLDFISSSHANASIIVKQQTEDNVEKQMRSKHIVIGSDGLHTGRLPHPRLYGTFPRVLGYYSRERKVVPLKEAIHKMTFKTADILGITDRGSIEIGKQADITIFNPSSVIDKATFENPRQTPIGIEYVIVNGNLAVAKGELTGIYGGKGVRF